MAGPNLTESCSLTTEIAERFVNLSAANTLSQRDLWYITAIEDGPAVLSKGTALVAIEELNGPIAELGTENPATATVDSSGKVLFPGSVIFNVTAFMDPLSVELASGSYVEYVDSQNIVRVMTQEGFEDIKWTGMVIPPEVLDVRAAKQGIQSSATSSGVVAASAVGAVMIIGLAGFVILESSSAARSSPLLPV